MTEYSFSIFEVEIMQNFAIKKITVWKASNQYFCMWKTSSKSEKLKLKWNILLQYSFEFLEINSNFEKNKKK